MSDHTVPIVQVPIVQVPIVQVEDRLPLVRALPLALQHLFAMFGATVLVPFLLTADPGTALLMNGIGTLLYLALCGWRIPAYLGSSFAFLAPVGAILADPSMGGFAAAQSGFIAFGLCFLVVAGIVRAFGTGWLDVVFPPAAMGAVVAVIGLELAPVALDMAGLTGKAGAHAHAGLVALVTLTVATLGALVFRGFMATIPVLLAVLTGYALAAVLGMVDFAPVGDAAWFALPHFAAPTFSVPAIVLMLPAAAVVLAEHVGHLVVTGEVVGRDLMRSPGLARSLAADGLANVLSGFAGAPPNTTYGENIGVMAITRVYSTQVIAGAALLAITIAFVGKLTALVRSIPAPVMGGVCILLFGVIAVAGVRMLIERRVDYRDPRNVALTAVPLVAGLGGGVLKLGAVELKGMALAAFVAVVIAVVTAGIRRVRR